MTRLLRIPLGDDMVASSTPLEFALYANSSGLSAQERYDGLMTPLIKDLIPATTINKKINAKVITLKTSQSIPPDQSTIEHSGLKHLDKTGFLHFLRYFDL